MVGLARAGPRAATPSARTDKSERRAAGRSFIEGLSERAMRAGRSAPSFRPEAGLTLLPPLGKVRFGSCRTEATPPDPVMAKLRQRPGESAAASSAVPRRRPAPMPSRRATTWTNRRPSRGAGRQWNRTGMVSRIDPPGSRRRGRHRAGAAHHRDRGPVEFGIAGTARQGGHGDATAAVDRDGDAGRAFRAHLHVGLVGGDMRQHLAVPVRHGRSRRDGGRRAAIGAAALARFGRAGLLTRVLAPGPCLGDRLSPCFAPRLLQRLLSFLGLCLAGLLPGDLVRVGSGRDEVRRLRPPRPASPRAAVAEPARRRTAPAQEAARSPEPE